MRVNEFSEVVLLCSLCGIFFFSQYRRTSKSPCIIECQPASTDFAYIGKESVFGWDVLCSVSNSSYTVRIREKKCPLKMKWLWYESKSSCEREDFFCPEYRIECAKSSIIECDIFIIDSCFYESEAHHLWFVVLPSTIVSWDEDTLYLSSFVEFFCSLDTCSEKEVWALWSRRCSEKKSKLIFRDSIHVFIYSLISCHTDKNPRKYEDDERTDEKKKELVLEVVESERDKKYFQVRFNLSDGNLLDEKRNRLLIKYLQKKHLRCTNQMPCILTRKRV